MRFRQQQRQLQPMLNEKKTIPVVFKYPAASKDKEAFLIGSFTNWKESVAMVKRFADSIRSDHAEIIAALLVIMISL